MNIQKFLTENIELATKILNKEKIKESEILHCVDVIQKNKKKNIVVISKLRKLEESLSTLRKNLIIFFYLNSKVWVSMYFKFKKINSSLVCQVFYVSPDGSAVPKFLRNTINSIFSYSLEMVFYTSKNNKENYNSTIASLTNVNILLTLDYNNMLTQENFNRVEFNDSSENIKLQLNTLLDVFIPTLISNQTFLDYLNKAVISSQMQSENESMQQMKSLKLAANDFTYLGQNFPEETKIFKRIFELFEDLRADQDLEKILKKVCDNLKLDYNHWISFYKVETKVFRKVLAKKIVKIPSLKTIRKLLPETRTIIFDPREKSWETLLDELWSSEDTEVATIDSFRSIFSTVDENRRADEKIDLSKVRKWAQPKKRSEKKFDFEDFKEVVVMLDRVFLQAMGKELKRTQILALLVFCYANSKNGKLCQVQTSEGKTVITALVAVMKALQGHKIDILTSNQVLANLAVDELRNFYGIFGLSVASNISKSGQEMGNYDVDVLYGTMSSFQFDYLRDQMKEPTTRCGRKFDIIVLDEVDSMLVDNGAHIARLATSFPGMECLRYMYIKIWDEIHKKDLDSINSIHLRMKKEVEKMDYLIPAHLIRFVKKQLGCWIRNAIAAKNEYHEFQQYRIQQNKVVPLDYLNTGLRMNNVTLSSGLTQFIQLKHNIELTFENLTSSFISNISFVKKYQNRNIFGLTGTLGSENERIFLSHIYDVGFFIVPTHKMRNFEELEGVVTEDNFHWQLTIVSLAIENCEKGRATLIICKTQEDVLKLTAMFEYIKSPENVIWAKSILTLIETKNGTTSRAELILKLIIKESYFSVRKILNEDDLVQIENKLQPRDIILATNVAGRGVDLKTTEQLEQNGGLHVCVAFLPRNKRVEDQAFGRTARHGNKGTAQLVIDPGEILAHYRNFDEIKAQRDVLEGKRLEMIKNSFVKKILFKDELFDCFAKRFMTLKKKFRKKEYHYILEDFKEFFAMWQKLEFHDDYREVNPETEFKKFEEKAIQIISGLISFNPFNCLASSLYYSEHENKKKADKMLEESLRISKGRGTLTEGIYLKLAESAIDRPQVVYRRVKRLFTQLLFIDKVDNAVRKIIKQPLNNYSSNCKYKSEAKRYLLKAQRILSRQLEQFSYFIDNIKCTNDNNGLALRLVSMRCTYLKMFHSNIEELIGELEKSGDKDVAFRFKIPLRADGVHFSSKNIVTELKALGLHTFYSLTKIHEVPRKKILVMQGQIAVTCGGLVAGCYFCNRTTLQMVTWSVMDIFEDLVMEILTGGREDNDEYSVKKAISKKVVKLFGKILTGGTLLKNSKIMRILFFGLNHFIKMFTENISEEFRNTYPLYSIVLEGCIDFMEDYQRIPFIFKTSVLRQTQEVIAPIIYNSCGINKPIECQLKIYVSRIRSLRMKLETNETGEIYNLVTCFLNPVFTFNVGLLKSILLFLTVINKTDSSLAYGMENILDITKFYYFFINPEFEKVVEELCVFLNKNLKNCGKQCNNLDIIVAHIAEALFKKYLT